MKRNLLNSTIALLLCVFLALATGCVSQTKYQSLQTDYLALHGEFASLQTELNAIQTELATTQAELEDTQAELSATQAELSATQDELDVALAELNLYQDTGIEVYSDVQPNVMINSAGEPASLINNTAAHNPTWSELVSFISNDDTDSQLYGFPNLCGWFAEQVHNNAEEAGIKAAFVVVNFEVGIGHGLNAFKTTDRGLVFIDCTGQGIQAVYPTYLYIVIGDTNSNDKVAYIEIGKPLGWITLGCPYGLSYADYEQWKIDVEIMISKFQAATTNSEMYRLKNESDSNLGSFWEEDEIVESIEIYW